MERKLQQLIRDVSVVSDIKNRDPINPLIVQLEKDGVLYPVLCALKEPIGLLFPINGIWIVLDPRSKYYNQALKLKSPTIANDMISDGGFTFGWNTIYALSEIFDAIPIYSTDSIEGPIGPTGEAGYVGNYDVYQVIQDALALVLEQINQSLPPDEPAPA